MVRIERVGDDLDVGISRAFAIPGALFLVPIVLAVVGAWLDVALFPLSISVLALGVLVGLFLLHGATTVWQHDRSLFVVVSTLPIALFALLPVAVWMVGGRLGLPSPLVHLLAAIPLALVGALLLTISRLLRQRGALEIDGEAGLVRDTAPWPLRESKPLSGFSRIEIRKPRTPYLTIEVHLIGEAEILLLVGGDEAEGQLMAARVARETGLPILDRRSTTAEALQAAARLVRIGGRPAPKWPIGRAGAWTFGAVCCLPLGLSLLGCASGRDLFPWGLPVYALLPVLSCVGTGYSAVRSRRGEPSTGSIAGAVQSLAVSLVPLGAWYGLTWLGIHPLLAELVSGAPVAFLGVGTLWLLAASGRMTSTVELNLDTGETRTVVDFDGDPAQPPQRFDRVELRPGPELVLVGASELHVMAPTDPAQAQERAARLATTLGLPLTGADVDAA